MLGAAVGEVELPLVDRDTAIEAALDVMRNYGRSGVVTTRHGSHVVLTDEDLIDALRESGNLKLREIEPTKKTTAIPDEIATTESFTLEHRERLYRDMRVGGMDYGIAIAATIRVLTLHEGLAAALSQAVTVCRCRKNPQHVWRPVQLKSGKCRLDGEGVDCN